jgi:hypothetical protein
VIYRKSKREEDGHLNPFVVLFDCTISLAFILIIYTLVNSLANSQSLVSFNKKRRQEAVRLAVLKAIAVRYPSATLSSYNKDTGNQWLTASGRRIADVYENESYQRVSLYLPVFSPRSSEISAEHADLVVEIASIVKSNWEYLSYLNLHGVADEKEAPTETDRVELSRSRADRLLGKLQDRLIVDKGNRVPNLIPLQFAVAYGTGSKLYADVSNNSRVDFVLFYSGETK